MPLYEFYCEDCNDVFDCIVPIGTKEYTCMCGSKAHKIMSLSNFKLKGGGWAADGYSGNKGAKDCNKSKGG